MKMEELSILVVMGQLGFVNFFYYSDASQFLLMGKYTTFYFDILNLQSTLTLILILHGKRPWLVGLLACIDWFKL